MANISTLRIDLDTEETVGQEDRIFATIDVPKKWYWQCRGSSDCFGPFASREAAIDDYQSV